MCLVKVFKDVKNWTKRKDRIKRHERWTKGQEGRNEKLKNKAKEERLFERQMNCKKDLIVKIQRFCR
jgi:hypothetical protein